MCQHLYKLYLAIFICLLIAAGCSFTKNENEISAHAKFTPIGLEIIDVGFRIYNKQSIGESDETVVSKTIRTHENDNHDRIDMESTQQNVKKSGGRDKEKRKSQKEKNKPSPLMPFGILATLITMFRRKENENDVQTTHTFGNAIDSFVPSGMLESRNR